VEHILIIAFRFHFEVSFLSMDVNTTMAYRINPQNQVNQITAY